MNGERIKGGVVAQGFSIVVMPDPGIKVFQDLWELASLKCSTWKDFRSKTCLLHSEASSYTIFQPGISVMQLLLSMPKEAYT